MIAATTAAATLLLAPAAQAAVAWVGGFETGDLSQWTFVAHGEYIDVQQELVGEGEYAARVELHNDAVWPNGLKRVELQHLPDAYRTAEGATTWFAFSFYLPEALPEEYDHAIAYWESNNTFSQVMAFNVQGDDIIFATRRPSNVQQWVASDVVTPGVWHRIAMRITWSTGNGGSVSAWFDGEQVVDDAVAQTLADGNAHFVQIGILRDALEFADAPVIILDDAVEGDSFEDVRPLDIPGVGGEDGGSSGDDGGESSGGAGDDNGGDGGAEVGGLDTSGGAPGESSTTIPAGDTGDAPGTTTGADALPPGFSATGDEAGASGDEGNGCQCSSQGSSRSGAAWGLAAVLVLGVRRRLARRR